MFFSLFVLCVVATVGKLFGAGVAAIATGNSIRESSAIAFLMNTRGLVELIVLNVGLSAGILNVRTFSVMVIMCLFTTFITSPIVSFVYPVEHRKQGNAEGAEEVAEVELIKKDFTEDDLKGLPTTTNRIAVIVDYLPMMQPIVQVLSYFLPHSIGSQLSVTAMHFIEATKTHRDEFLGLNPEGRLIRVDEEATDLFAAYKMMEDPAAKKPEMLLISGFCKANAIPVNAFRIEGDAIEYPSELKSIAANNDASLICLPFRGNSSFFRSLFWSSLQHTPAPVLLLLPVMAQKLASEYDPSEHRERSNSLFASLSESYRATELKSDEEAGPGAPPLFTNQPLQVLPLHRRGSVTNKFQKVDCAGLDYNEVVILLTGKHADLVVLSLLPRFAENAVNKVTVMKPKDFASFNKAVLEALEEAKRLSQHQKNVVFVEIASISTDYEGLYQNVNEVPYDLLVCSFVEPHPVDLTATVSSRVARANTMKGASLVDMVLRGGGDVDPVEMRLQSGMPAQYAYSNLVYPELGMIGSKIHEGSHAKSSLVLIVHEGLKVQARGSVVSERTDLTQAIELHPASANASQM